MQARFDTCVEGQPTSDSRISSGWKRVDMRSILLICGLLVAVAFGPLAFRAQYELAMEPYRAASPSKQLSHLHVGVRMLDLSAKLLKLDYPMGVILVLPCMVSFVLLVSSAVNSFLTESLPISLLHTCSH